LLDEELEEPLPFVAAVLVPDARLVAAAAALEEAVAIAVDPPTVTVDVRKTVTAVAQLSSVATVGVFFLPRTAEEAVRYKKATKMALGNMFSFFLSNIPINVDKLVFLFFSRG